MKHLVFLVIGSLAVQAWAQAPAKPEPAKDAAKPVAQEAVPMKDAAPPKQAAAASKKQQQPRRWNEDARHCLERASNTEIIKCAEEFL